MAGDCPKCAELSERSASLYAEYLSARDELTMTRKNDPSYARKRAEVERLDGLKRDAYLQSSVHHKEHRTIEDAV
jgi:hypothetical protein